MRFIYLIPALFLTGCLAADGGSTPEAAKVSSPEVVAPEPDLVALPSSIVGKALSSSNGALTVSATEVIDPRCGARFTIESTETVGDVFIIRTQIQAPSFVDPGNTDCMVRVINPNGVSNTCTPLLYSNLLTPTYINYRVELVSGSYAITRDLESLNIKRTCTSPIIITREAYSMAEEMYYE
jgi:hypothetical protein